MLQLCFFFFHILHSLLLITCLQTKRSILKFPAADNSKPKFCSTSCELFSLSCQYLGIYLKQKATHAIVFPNFGIFWQGNYPRSNVTFFILVLSNWAPKKTTTTIFTDRSAPESHKVSLQSKIKLAANFTLNVLYCTKCIKENRFAHTDGRTDRILKIGVIVKNAFYVVFML